MNSSEPRRMNPRVESDHPLHQAIVEGDIESVQRFLVDGGSPNITDSYDCEPIFTAVKYDRIEIAQILIKAGGDITRCSKLRGSAFGAACWNWNLRMIDFCVAAGIDINDESEGETILDSLTRQRKSIPETALPVWKDAYDRLVKHGAKHSHELPLRSQTADTGDQRTSGC